MTDVGFGAPLPGCVNPDLAALCDPVVAGFAQMPIGSIPPIVTDISGTIPIPFGGLGVAHGPQTDLIITNTSSCLLDFMVDITPPSMFLSLPVASFVQLALLINFGSGATPTPITGPGTFFSQNGFVGQENTGTFVERNTNAVGTRALLFPLNLSPGASFFLSLRVAAETIGFVGGFAFFVGGPSIRVIGLNAGAP